MKGTRPLDNDADARAAVEAIALITESDRNHLLSSSASMSPSLMSSEHASRRIYRSSKIANENAEKPGRKS